MMVSPDWMGCSNKKINEARSKEVSRDNITDAK